MIDYVGAALLNLFHRLGKYTIFIEKFRCSPGSHYIKTGIAQPLGYIKHLVGLVLVFYAYEGHSAGRKTVAGRDLDLANAWSRSGAIPMTSPVDFISGPRIVSTSGNLTKGKTDSFTQ